MGAGSREHVGLWITLASMDGWMDVWLGLGWAFPLFFFFLAAPVRVGGGREIIGYGYSDLVKMMTTLLFFLFLFFFV